MSGVFSTLKRWYRFVADFNKAMNERNIGLLSAGVAFFALLALFPGIAALISIVGVFADPLLVQDQLQLIEDLVPPAAFTLLSNQITRLVWSDDGILGWTSILSILIALFLARRGVDALLVGIYAIHGAPRRTGVAHAVRVLLITIGMLVAGVVALLSVLILPVVLTFFPLVGGSSVLLQIGRWSLTLGLVAGWIWVFYRIGPERPNPDRAVILPGLILAMTLWISVSVGFSYYLSNFGNYNEVYGSLGAVVALLMWFYISAYSVLLGGILNARIEAVQAEPRETTESAGVSPMSGETAPQESG